METLSPYAPPRSDVGKPEERAGSPLKAVLLGLLTDIGGSTLFGVVLVIGYGVFLAANGADTDAVAEQMQDANLLPMMIVIGSLFSVAGGFVCARVVKRNELRWGAVTGACSAFLGFLMGMDDLGATDVLLILAAVPTVMLGAWLGLRRNRAIGASR